MSGDGKFGVQEAVFLVTLTTSSKIFYSSPATVVELVGAAGWYMTLISAAVALLGFWFIYLLLKRFPGKDLTEIFAQTLGHPLGFVFSNTIGFLALVTATTRLAEFTEVIKVYAFPLSPNWYIVAFFIVSIFFLSRLGIEGIARITVLLFFPMILGYITVIILSTQNFRLCNLYPILGHGLKKTVRNGIIRSSAYGEIIILAIFAKSFQGIKYIKREGFLSLGLSALILSTSFLFFNLSFPYYLGREVTAPMYEMALLIDYGESLQRVESVFLFIWIISSLISTATMFYSFIWIFCQTFKISDKNPIILGGCLLLFAISLMHRDMTSVIVGRVEFIRKFGSLVFIIPFVALVVSVILKKGANTNA